MAAPAKRTPAKKRVPRAVKPVEDVSLPVEKPATATAPVKGVDTIDHTLTGATLKANGYQFVCRYYAGGTSHIGKEITAAEIVEKSAAGVRIVSNWETNGSPADTVGAGELDARAFLKQHAAVGGPDGVPCYFSIDHNVTHPTVLDNYAQGLVNVLGVERVGVYGASALVRHWLAAGLATYGWRSMSTAWLGGSDATGCALVQTGRGEVAGHDVDFNTAQLAVYGGWLLGEDEDMAYTDADANLNWHSSRSPGAGLTDPRDGKTPMTPAAGVEQALAEAHAANKAVAALAASIAAGVPMTINEADKADIAAQVADLLSKRLEN